MFVLINHVPLAHSKRWQFFLLLQIQELKRVIIAGFLRFTLDSSSLGQNYFSTPIKTKRRKMWASWQHHFGSHFLLSTLHPIESKQSNFLSLIRSCENWPMIEVKKKPERNKWETIEYWHSELALITAMRISGVIFVVVSYIVEFCHVSFFKRIFRKRKKLKRMFFSVIPFT